MASGQLNGVIQNLRRSALMSDEGGLTDAQLLDAFILNAEEAAFEALVRRHAPMVWGVCLRVLGHSHDAEDAFQATFLVLLRKAESIWPRAMVGNWLYGVAYRTALKAKGAAAKRKAREKQVDEMPAKEVHDEKVWSDLKPLLDRELNRLADKYRVPVVLCDLEGKSQREAARQLGWPEGTLSSRLAAGRRMLARRLNRRGVSLSRGAVPLWLSQIPAEPVPPPLVATTIDAGMLAAAGHATASTGVSAAAAGLADAVIKSMLLAKLKLVTLAMVALVVAVAALGWFVGSPMRRASAEGDTIFREMPGASVDRAERWYQGPSVSNVAPPPAGQEIASVKVSEVWVLQDGKFVGMGRSAGAPALPPSAAHQMPGIALRLALTAQGESDCILEGGELVVLSGRYAPPKMLLHSQSKRDHRILVVGNRIVLIGLRPAASRGPTNTIRLKGPFG
jgi:RNA polymerase sigma factor (sigma-70 family)